LTAEILKGVKFMLGEVNTLVAFGKLILSVLGELI